MKIINYLMKAAVTQFFGQWKQENNGDKQFTLIELLVVISIIAILASILLPALKKAKDSSSKIICSGRMKQLYTGIYMYSQDYDGWLVLGGNSAQWRVSIYPYVGGNINLDAYSTTYDKLSALLPKTDVYHCPSLPQNIKDLSPTINGIGWNYYYLGYEEFDTAICPRININQVLQPSRTFALGDTKNITANVFNNYHLYYPPLIGNALTPRHSNGLNIAYADGHCVWHPINYILNNNDLYKRDH